MQQNWFSLVSFEPPFLMDYSSSAMDRLPDYVQTVVVKDSKGLEKILLLPKALDLDRPKRSRTAFAKWQLDALETHFGTNPYLIGEQRTQLAKRLGLSETQIKVWYQNRRTKQRKEGNISSSSSSGLPSSQSPADHQQQQHPPPPSSNTSKVMMDAMTSSFQQQCADLFNRHHHHISFIPQYNNNNNINST